MHAVWKCPNNHQNSFKVIEYSPEINLISADESVCEECGIKFNDRTWIFIFFEYDDEYSETGDSLNAQSK